MRPASKSGPAHANYANPTPEIEIAENKEIVSLAVGWVDYHSLILKLGTSRYHVPGSAQSYQHSEKERVGILAVSPQEGASLNGPHRDPSWLAINDPSRLTVCVAIIFACFIAGNCIVAVWLKCEWGWIEWTTIFFWHLWPHQIVTKS